MKKFLLIALSLVSFAGMNAGQKADLRVRPLVEAAQKMQVDPSDNLVLNSFHTMSVSAPVNVDNRQYIPLLITLDEASSVAQLEELGIEISVAIDNIISCYVPVDVYDAMEALDCVQIISPVQEYRQNCNIARVDMGVDLCHNGTGLKQAYKGDGTFVGIFDSGLDPNHVNFYNSTQSASRVKRMWYYTENSFTHKAVEKVMTSTSEIAAFTTDDKDNTHGTHVLGIATGAYKGSGTDYSGMAPNADILIGCGYNNDDAVLKGVTAISTYAYDEVNRPVAINLSLGRTVGHHDGTGAHIVGLNKIAEFTPICVAAGNEGDLNIVVKKTCTASDNKVQVLLNANKNQATADRRYQAYGSFEVICNDKTPFTLSVGIYNVSSKRVIASVQAGDGKYNYIGGNDAAVSGSLTKNSTINSSFSSDSYIGAAVGVCSDNGRYYGFIQADMYNTQSAMNLFPVIIVQGVAGKSYEMYGDGYYTDFVTLGDANFDEPTHDGTVNDLATGKNTICVGAYVTRNYSPLGISNVGEVAGFSAFGTLKDGRKLPHICAPGAGIISSYSRFYVDGSSVYNRSTEPIHQTINFGGHKNYWSIMAGTSMATPAMTGTVALWCQANPDLYPDEIIEIAKKTAKVDSYVRTGAAYSPVQWGAGKVDAYNGLKMVLGLNSVENVIDRGDPAILLTPIGDDQYEIFAPHDDSFTVNVVNLAGQTVKTMTSEGDTLPLDCSAFAPGIYVVNVSGQHDTLSEKIQVR